MCTKTSKSNSKIGKYHGCGAIGASPIIQTGWFDGVCFYKLS
jgi:hypothetical protein